MRLVLIPLLLVEIVLGFANMGFAQRVYLYKDVNDINPGYHKLYKHWLRPQIEPEMSISFDLPKQSKGEQEFWFSLGGGVKPLSQVETKFMLEIVEISLRNEKNYYAPYLHKSTLRRYKGNIVVLQSGKIVGRESIKFDIDQMFGARFGVKIDTPLPDTLYLDYKLRITSEAGEKDVLAGTVTMQKTSYKVQPRNPFFR